jgi:hypothetical protein
MSIAVQKLSPANNELTTKTRHFRIDADVFCVYSGITGFLSQKSGY